MDQGAIQYAFELVVLLSLAVNTIFAARLLNKEDRRQIEVFVLPVANIITHFEFVRLANHFVNGAETELSHDFTQALCHVLEEGHNVIHTASKTLTQSFVLCGDTDRASVFMTFTHHDTAFNHQCSGCDAPFFSAQQYRNRDIAWGFHLSIGLHHNAVTQAVFEQSLVGFSQTQFPR
ncbi:Uncharacterised protein [Vibrio cholerae]|uniref:Uncharacterized protein n=1 Tax=Vibrio cholerae TaxID=666 RepID=A0A655P8W7_VIBCL|nr:Uncharacterised protein [Vibrio cholerae]CSB23532.1 Uncharacterised protein [Vibrio cholerae]CSB26442.1 Uncharacterised protein [Vibrio cholerae]CSB28293.1 Uncharacterised protein [Vibrio cholerae]CSB36294.1 Uncharacterised protein [Vibrio cholerae]